MNKLHSSDDFTGRQTLITFLTRCSKEGVDVFEKKPGPWDFTESEMRFINKLFVNDLLDYPMFLFLNHISSSTINHLEEMYTMLEEKNLPANQMMDLFIGEIHDYFFENSDHGLECRKNFLRNFFRQHSVMKYLADENLLSEQTLQLLLDKEATAQISKQCDEESSSKQLINILKTLSQSSLMTRLGETNSKVGTGYILQYLKYPDDCFKFIDHLRKTKALTHKSISNIFNIDEVKYFVRCILNRPSNMTKYKKFSEEYGPNFFEDKHSLKLLKAFCQNFTRIAPPASPKKNVSIQAASISMFPPANASSNKRSAPSENIEESGENKKARVTNT